ncbi:MAG: lipid II:glycine glycyltransferase FemX [Bacteroidota bacterium]
MNFFVDKKPVRELESGKIVQQTLFWANVKKQQGIRPVAFHFEVPGELLFPDDTGHNKVSNDLLVLLRPVDREYCYAYVPYGPKIQPAFENYGLFLEELSERLKAYLPGKCILIRYDLPWENIWAREEDYYDEAGNWTGPPSDMSQEFRLNFNTRNKNLFKSYSNNLPANTIFLNLRHGNEDLLERMKSKTRYNIRLSGKKGIRVRDYGMEHLKDWYEMYRETVERNRITLHGRKYFYNVLAAGMSDEVPVDTHLLMADYNGEYLAALMLVLSGKRGTYLYGASSGKMRNRMATYALQWEAINMARTAGCEEYDMFGIAPNADPSHPLHGLYRFKTGFGGRVYHRMGCWDYPLIHELYRTFRASEVNSQSYPY